MVAGSGRSYKPTIQGDALHITGTLVDTPVAKEFTKTSVCVHSWD